MSKELNQAIKELSTKSISIKVAVESNHIRSYDDLAKVEDLSQIKGTIKTDHKLVPRCKECGFKIKSNNHELGVHHKQKKVRKK